MIRIIDKGILKNWQDTLYCAAWERGDCPGEYEVPCYTGIGETYCIWVPGLVPVKPMTKTMLAEILMRMGDQ